MSHRWCGASAEVRAPFRAATVRSHGDIARTYCTLAEQASLPAALLLLPDSLLAMRPGSTKELGNCSSPRSAGKWHSSAEMLATDVWIRDLFFVILPRSSLRQVLRPRGTCLLSHRKSPATGIVAVLPWCISSAQRGGRAPAGAANGWARCSRYCRSRSSESPTRLVADQPCACLRKKKGKRKKMAFERFVAYICSLRPGWQSRCGTSGSAASAANRRDTGRWSPGQTRTQRPRLRCTSTTHRLE